MYFYFCEKESKDCEWIRNVFFINKATPTHDYEISIINHEKVPASS